MSPSIQSMSDAQKDEVVSKICEIVARECRTAFGGRLISVILTGSAARGEATIVSSGDGWKILGDAEFLVVLHQAGGSARIRSRDTLKRESAEKLRLQGIEVTIGLGFVPVSYLKGLPAYIFSYELRECGKVVSGNPQILDVMPQFGASAISREDAWRLLCNRMIEQLEVIGDLERAPQQLTNGLHYATVKLYLDMATSYLVFAGAYAPTYRERVQRLMMLASQADHDSPFSLKDFGATVSECTSWKLNGKEDDRNRSLRFWQEAISYAHQLWRWEIVQMTGASSKSTDTELWTRLAEALTVREKIRGWLSVIKRSSASETLRNWPGWLRLGSRATPRYWVYRAGAEVLFDFQARVTASTKGLLDAADSHVASLLPVHRIKTGTAEISWKFIASEITANYWRYVAETRA